MSSEQVLVVPTALFHELGHFQGFSGEVDRYLQPLLATPQLSYRPRSEMEEDPSFKQLIPYIVFRYIDEQGTPHIFQYTRGKGQGENRLHSKRSIGIGGHISSEDASAQQQGSASYEAGMRREIAEEIAIDSPYTEQLLGLINDDETEVGRVHLGVVHVFDVEAPRVQPREVDIIETGFVPLDQLLQELDRFETWSQICLKYLGENR